MGYNSKVFIASTDIDNIRECVEYIEELYERTGKGSPASVFRIEGTKFSEPEQVGEFYITCCELHSCSFGDIEHWFALEGKTGLFTDVFFVANYEWLTGVVTLQKYPFDAAEVIHYTAANGVRTLLEYVYPYPYADIAQQLMPFMFDCFGINVVNLSH